MTKRIVFPSDVLNMGGQEIASIVLIDGDEEGEGKQLFIVDVTKVDPAGWGLLLCDFLRQVAASFESNGLMLDGRLLSKTEIEATLWDWMNKEFDRPTTDMKQVGAKPGN